MAEMSVSLIQEQESSDQSAFHVRNSTQQPVDKEQQLENILASIGGYGCFQIFTTVIVIFGMTAPNYYFYLIPFYTKQQVYKCTYVG